MKVVILSLLLCRPLVSQEKIVANPTNATLWITTPQWMVWNVVQPLPSFNARPVSQNSFYLQRVGEDHATLVYRDTIGMIQSFNPIWVYPDGTLIGWDGYFTLLKNGSIHAIETDSLPVRSLYVAPVLLATGDGVVMMANNDHSSTQALEAAYFVPWSFSNAILRTSDCALITDSIGLMFYDAQLRYSDETIFSLRPPVGFVYRLTDRTVRTIQFEKMTSAERLLGYDGNSVVTKDGNIVSFYDSRGTRTKKTEITEDAHVLAYRKGHLYAIQGYALTKSDTLVYLLQAFSEKTGSWIKLREVYPVEWSLHEIPTCMIQPDFLWLWTGGRWRKFNWLD